MCDNKISSCVNCENTAKQYTQQHYDTALAVLSNKRCVFRCFCVTTCPNFGRRARIEQWKIAHSQICASTCPVEHIIICRIIGYTFNQNISLIHMTSEMQMKCMRNPKCYYFHFILYGVRANQYGFHGDCIYFFHTKFVLIKR